MLQPGQAPFDWDTAGTKYPWEDPVEQGSTIVERLTHCEHYARLIAEDQRFPQETSQCVPADGVSFGYGVQTPQPTLLPVYHTAPELWAQSRSLRSRQPTPLITQSVRRDYRLQKDMWAWLGAVRRPDPAIFSLRKDAKTSAKGVDHIQGHPSLGLFQSSLLGGQS